MSTLFAVFDVLEDTTVVCTHVVLFLRRIGESDGYIKFPDVGKVGKVVDHTQHVEGADVKPLNTSSPNQEHEKNFVVQVERRNAKSQSSANKQTSNKELNG